MFSFLAVAEDLKIRGLTQSSSSSHSESQAKISDSTQRKRRRSASGGRAMKEEEEEEEEVQVITSMTAPQPDEVVMMDEEVSETGSEVGKKRWYEGCSYTCLACNKAYDIYFSYHGHIKKIHNMSMEQYHTTYGQEGEVNRYYSCKLCHTNVVWRLFNIRKHMESTHELTLDQYGQIYEGVKNFL